MSESMPRGPGRIFINYRREDTAYPAGWLFDRLVGHFSRDQVFKDVDSIELGDDFEETITKAVGSCDVLLALIGREWITITDDTGRRRLDNPRDFVRLEIEAALARNVRVIPVLVEGATIPRPEDLPTSLAKLTRYQALELNPSRFDFDTNRLVGVLERSFPDRARVQDDGPGIITAPNAGEPTPGPPTVTVGGGEQARSRQSRRVPGIHHRSSARRWMGLTGRTWICAGVAIAVGATLTLSIGLSGKSPSPAQGGRLIFADAFSGRQGGWETSGGGHGEYGNGLYRMYGDPGPDGDSAQSSPLKAPSVYPTAPGAVDIEVEAHRTSGPGQDAGAGIVCRVNGDGAYQFIVGSDSVSIAKQLTQPPYFRQLVVDPLTVDPTTPIHMRAVCTGDANSQHLQLFLNDQPVAQADDTDAPFSSGSVGLTVATGPGDSSIVAEFRNFSVKTVSGTGS